MKKLLLLTLTIAFSQSYSYAQTLTASNFNFVLGDVFTTQQCAYMSPGGSGAGQTWNFSTMTSTAVQTSTMVPPSSVSGGSAYTTANIAGDGTGGGKGFYTVNSSALLFQGTISGPVSIVYSNPETLIQYPFSFGNSFSDSWSATFSSAGTTYYRTGTSTVTADGTGTLTTPAGTFNNVLRYHVVQAYQDSANIGGPFIITYNMDLYAWVLPGIHNILASVSNLSSSISSPYQSSTYLSNFTTGIENIQGSTSSGVYPNPVSDKLNFSLASHGADAIDVKIYNVNGQEVLSQEGVLPSNGVHTVDVSSLPAGIYFSELTTEGALPSRMKFVIAR